MRERSDTSRSQIRNRGIIFVFENDIAAMIRVAATAVAAYSRFVSTPGALDRLRIARPHAMPAIEATSGSTGAKKRHAGIQSPPATITNIVVATIEPPV